MISKLVTYLAAIWAAIVLSALQPIAAQTTSVEIWIRSFIPNRHDGQPGYVAPVPNRPGLTMIRGPIPGVSDCFLTDNRGFSSDPNASARLGARITLDVGSPPIISSAQHPPSISVEVDCEDGSEECRKPVDTSRARVGPISRQGNVVTLSVHGEANNACFAGSPDIHYEGVFIIDLAANTIRFKGTIGHFPSFEAYARANSGAIRTVFRETPLGNSTAVDVPKSRSIDSPSVAF